MVRSRSTWLVSGCAGAMVMAAGAPGGASAQAAPAVPPPRAVANDNRTPAGVLSDGILRIHLVAAMSTWYPEAEDGPFKLVEAFGEPGHAPRIPGPLIRIPLGTTIEATLTNSLADTITVLGLQGRNDSIRLAPNETRRVRSKPDAPGTYLYRAGLMLGGKFVTKGTQQLVGGLIVDSGPPSNDRVFIASAWDPTPYFLAMNGKSWPYTEKFVHTVGDTVRWRVINAGGQGTGAHHPMHLHGFYYRVDARGGWDADTVYAESERRWVVTETLPGLGSMTMTWIPERAGNWLFHCHNSDHVAGRNRHSVAGTPRPFPEPATHDASEHMAWDMSGLVNAITILPRGGGAVAAEPAPANPRRIRILVQERPGVSGRAPGYGYVVQAGAAEPAADSISIPGPRLVLRRNEPVEITVVNRLGKHTAVHWHGIELESFYDGIAGWSGAGERLAPMIAPQDSFVVRFSPPRAGTFIYHSHITDYVQIARGLYGALLVVDELPVEGSDHVAIVSFGRPGGKASLLLNGSISPAPIERNRGRQRIRLINISTENGAIMTLTDGDTPVVWRAVAKDGFDLPSGQQRSGPARVHIFPGETYDFQFESAAGVLRLRMRNPNLTEGDDVSLELRTRR